MKRVEAFIKAQNGLKIKTLSGDDIARYIETTGRQNRLPGWQFRQCIDAIRIFVAIALQPLRGRMAVCRKIQCCAEPSDRLTIRAVMYMVSRTEAAKAYSP